MAYDNTNSGLLSKNDRMREGKNDPLYTGSAEVKCTCCNAVSKFWLSAWVKESGPNTKTPGRKFFSLSFRAQEPKPESNAPVMDAAPAAPTMAEAETGAPKYDDDIPF